MPRSDFWSGLAVVAFGLLALLWMIPNYAGSNPFAQMPPELVPSIAAWVMIVCGGLVAVGGLGRMLRDGVMPFPTAVDWRAIGWAVWPFLYVGAAIWVMNYVKVTVFGAFMIAGMLILFGERRWWMILGCSLVPIGLLYGLSVHLMRVGVV